MTVEQISIRPATDADLAAITDIYRTYVLESTASFELDAPDRAEMARRFADIAGRDFPYLVAARHDGHVVGYAYAGPYRPRAAWRYTVENSIYLDRNAIGQGVGRRLLTVLIAACREKDYRQIVAVIAGDNPASVRLHGQLGFQPVGVLKNVGFKFERWLDVTFMQLPLDQ